MKKQHTRLPTQLLDDYRPLMQRTSSQWDSAYQQSNAEFARGILLGIVFAIVVILALAILVPMLLPELWKLL